MEPNDRLTVKALLAAARITPSDEEVEAMAKSYPGLRSAADSLYTEAATRYLPAFYPTDAELEEK